MPLAPPVQVLPQWVDPRKFAQQGIEFSGEIPLKRLPRVVAANAETEHPLAVQVRFLVNENRNRIVSGSLAGVVKMVCQRCLEPLLLPVESTFSVAVVDSEERARQLPKDLEPWVVPQELISADLYELIEDELLLCLPMVSYHEQQCIDQKLYVSGEEELPPADEVAQAAPNPFAVLNKLKQPPD